MPEVYLTLRLLRASHRNLQRRSEKAQVMYTFPHNTDYAISHRSSTTPFPFSELKFCAAAAAAALTSAHTEYPVLERVSVPMPGRIFVQLGPYNL